MAFNSKLALLFFGDTLIIECILKYGGIHIRRDEPGLIRTDPESNEQTYKWDWKEELNISNLLVHFSQVLRTN